MDFGAFLDFGMRRGGTPEETYQENFKLIDLAEETGLDTVWLGESHFNSNRPLSGQLVVASAIAGRTRRLRVGTAVNVLPHPNVEVPGVLQASRAFLRRRPGLISSL